MRSNQLKVAVLIACAIFLTNFQDKRLANEDQKLEREDVLKHFQPREMSAEKMAKMSKLYLALSDISKWYLKKQNSNVSDYEVGVWRHAVFSMMEQERVWQRLMLEKKSSLGKLKVNHKEMMRSKEFSFLTVSDQASWRFVKRFLDSMEGYYIFWKRAPLAKCVANGDGISRSRAAYSAYDGGVKEMCRWSDPYASKSHKDRAFYLSMQKPFKKVGKEFVKKTITKAEVPKKLKRISVQKPRFKQNLIQLPNQKICLRTRNKLDCVEKRKDLLCLNSLRPLKELKPHPVKWKDVRGMPKKNLKRFDLCEDFNPELRAISSLIKTKRKVKLRKKPGGKFLTVVPKGAVLKVRDFSLESAKEKHTYYKVNYEGKVGYIYAGTEKTSDRWIKTVSRKKKKKNLAKLVRKFKRFLQL